MSGADANCAALWKALENPLLGFQDMMIDTCARKQQPVPFTFYAPYPGGGSLRHAVSRPDRVYVSRELADGARCTMTKCPNPLGPDHASMIASINFATIDQDTDTVAAHDYAVFLTLTGGARKWSLNKEATARYHSTAFKTPAVAQLIEDAQKRWAARAAESPGDITSAMTRLFTDLCVAMNTAEIVARDASLRPRRADIVKDRNRLHQLSRIAAMAEGMHEASLSNPTLPTLTELLKLTTEVAGMPTAPTISFNEGDSGNVHL